MHSIITLAIFVAVGAETTRPDDLPYGVGSWPAELGDQRAVVQVDRPGEAVRRKLPWQRDVEPSQKGVPVYDAAAGNGSTMRWGKCGTSSACRGAR